VLKSGPDSRSAETGKYPPPRKKNLGRKELRQSKNEKIRKKKKIADVKVGNQHDVLGKVLSENTRMDLSLASFSRYMHTMNYRNDERYQNLHSEL